MPNPDDIWYAIANTEVVLPPEKRLETFGGTVIHYHLIAENMDSVNQIRIREGRVHAERPRLLTPAYFENVMLEGFAEEAKAYVDWLRAHFKDLALLKYGFQFRKEEMKESIAHDSLEAVTDRVKKLVEERGDPLAAVIKGVDDAWEVCLLKFMTDIIRQSMPEHVKDFQRRHMFQNVNGVQRAVHEEIEEDFVAVENDASRMKALGAKLRQYGIFENYEDRFYELVRRLSRS